MGVKSRNIEQILNEKVDDIISKNDAKKRKKNVLKSTQPSIVDNKNFIEDTNYFMAKKRNSKKTSKKSKKISSNPKDNINYSVNNTPSNINSSKLKSKNFDYVSLLKGVFISSIIIAGLYFKFREKPKYQNNLVERVVNTQYTRTDSKTDSRTIYTPQIIEISPTQKNKQTQQQKSPSIVDSIENINSRLINQSRIQNTSNLESRLRNINSKITLPKGEYHIDFDITISKGGFLTIEPGTIIKFGRNGGIVGNFHHGSGLIARGTSNEKIIFTANNDYWKNISLEGNLTDVFLEHCIIKKGSGRSNGEYKFRDFKGYKLGGGLAIIGGRANIQNCEINNNKADIGGGIFLLNSNSFIDNNYIHNNYANHGGGIYIHKSSSNISKNIIENNTANNFGSGIGIIQSYNLIVDNNTIRRNIIVNGTDDKIIKESAVNINQSVIAFLNNKIYENKCNNGAGLVFNSTFIFDKNNPNLRKDWFNLVSYYNRTTSSNKDNPSTSINYISSILNKNNNSLNRNSPANLHIAWGD
jgi:hypothetical protein